MIAMPNATRFGPCMSNAKLPEWDRVVSAAAHLQTILPDAALVGDFASAVHAEHRMSVDADHVLTYLRSRFDAVLAELESVAGWKRACIRRPVQILGKLDGIETGSRQLICDAPLETQRERFDVQGAAIEITLPTPAEMLRIKAVLIFKRNSTRDYLEFAALSDRLGAHETRAALAPFDALYPQSNGESPLMQLQIQLAKPPPFDLDAIELAEYKQLSVRWHEWNAVVAQCASVSINLFE